jgi:mannonate dehydratase
MLMEHMMRWFGPGDPVGLWDIRQAGCTGVVSALHHVPVGAIWPVEEIMKRKQQIEQAGMRWTVIESLPVHEDIKKGSGAKARQYIENYKSSLRNIAVCGLKVITYNFMPVMDWMRTDLSFELEDKSRALRFEKAAFVAFDAFLLERPGAELDYSQKEIHLARERFHRMSLQEKQDLMASALMGLPGSEEQFSVKQMLEAIQSYAGIGPKQLKEHLFYFLQQVVPVAEQCGLQMAIHPDDPPFPILGLPRIVSTEQDAVELLNAAPSPANGLCFCTGSYGVRADNDLPGMIERLGNHIHFLHLRSTKRDGEGNFFEANHLEGDVDMFQVVEQIVMLMNRRGVSIPMRPDHGHVILDDIHKKTNPGYSAIGRLRGLAEIRGLELGISRNLQIRP